MRAIFIRRNHFYLFVAVVVTVWLFGFCYFLKDPEWGIGKYFNNKEQIDKQMEKFSQFFQENNERLHAPIAPAIKNHKPLTENVEFIGEPAIPTSKQVKYGEMGKGVIISDELPPEVLLKVAEGWKNHSFNQYVSDLIGVKRSLPDYRDEWCTIPYRYDIKLPKTSIIICFFNEAWSTLIRSVNSVLDRTPPHLLEDIILVDDFSSMTHLKKPLEDYFKRESKVKIVRNTQREGIIRSRMIGMSHTKSEVLTFLDSHIEATPGWLEPLLEQIRVNYTTVVSPVIDIIHYTTFEYIPHKKDNINIGGFDWNLVFTWHKVPQREDDRRTDAAEPVYSPTMAGGLFSISRKFFEELGTYDPDLEVWGGENLELSFKIWMCGGSLQIIPCSHVGHVFRVSFPYLSNGESTKNIVDKNHKRIAEVWMDEYKEYYYTRKGAYYKDIEYGDVSNRKQLRKDLHCQSFNWYLDNIYPELFIPEKIYGYGVIGTADWKFCLDSWGRDTDVLLPLPVKTCYADSLGGSQFWYYSHNKEIRKEAYCVDSKDFNGNLVTLLPCVKESPTQKWIFDSNTKYFINDASKKCLDVSSKQLTVTDCGNDSPHQQWFIQHLNGTQNSPYSFSVKKLTD